MSVITFSVPFKSGVPELPPDDMKAAAKSFAWKAAIVAESNCTPSRTLAPEIAAKCPEAARLLMRGWEIIATTGTLAKISHLNKPERDRV